MKRNKNAQENAKTTINKMQKYCKQMQTHTKTCAGGCKNIKEHTNVYKNIQKQYCINL